MRVAYNITSFICIGNLAYDLKWSVSQRKHRFYFYGNSLHQYKAYSVQTGLRRVFPNYGLGIFCFRTCGKRLTSSITRMRQIKNNYIGSNCWLAKLLSNSLLFRIISIQLINSHTFLSPLACLCSLQNPAWNLFYWQP